MSRHSGKNTLIFILAVVAAVALDQVLKAVVAGTVLPGQRITLVPHVLWLTYSTNSGAAFGLLRGNGQLIFFSSLILVMLMLAWFFWSRNRMGSMAFVGLGLVIGGAVGNLADRIFRGEVVDFLDLGWWPVFNIADMAILAGAIIVLVVYTRELWREGNLAGP